MGSESDLPTMQAAADVLTELGVSFEMRVLSAHRTPDRMTDYARSARKRGAAGRHWRGGAGRRTCQG